MKKAFNCIFDQKNNTFKAEYKNIYHYEDDVYDVFVIGSVTIGNATNQGKVIIEAFSAWNQEITKHIKGLYILVIWEKETKVLHVFHDRITSPSTIYYTQDGHLIHVSISLRSLLLKSRINRELNNDVIQEYLINGFVYGNRTLVKNVYKLWAYECWRMDSKQIEVLPAHYRVEPYEMEEAVAKWKETLDESIIHCSELAGNYCITLSSGYDSNYIAHILDCKTDKTIQAFSIGGKNGQNEIPLVKQNVSAYHNINLKTKLTDASSLQSFPDIVSRLEGLIFERGVFLQYELAKLVSSNGYSKLICGECADQVCNENFIYDVLLPQERDNLHERIKLMKHPFLFASAIILKKNSLMMDSFGIEAYYPYLADNFVSLAHAARYINKNDKRLHKANCERVLPEAIIKNISKKPGTTEMHSLFENSTEMNAFYKIVEQSTFYEKFISKPQATFPFENNKIGSCLRNQIKTVLKSGYNKLFRKNQVYACTKEDAHISQERKLAQYLCITSLIIFEKMFILSDIESLKEEDRSTDSLNMYL